jgi:pimeloyl-ACP methyl ester carboxylesterase
VTLVDVNGAQLWIEDRGNGPAILFVHGGLGDSRLWEPQAGALSSSFRAITYDLRFWGRATSPGVEFSMVDDLIGVLDASGVERAALVGLSMGGGLVLDAALAHPERVWALVHVAGGASGRPVNPYSDDQDAQFEAAVAGGDLESAMEIDFAVWAPLGADEELRRLWQSVPEARGLPEGAMFAAPEPAYERLEQIQVPTLVVLAAHDPAEQREVGTSVAARIPGATLVEVDSDHYLTLREPDRIAELLAEFLTSSTPSSSSY